jgi:hypothetical protein
LRRVSWVALGVTGVSFIGGLDALSLNSIRWFFLAWFLGGVLLFLGGNRGLLLDSTWYLGGEFVVFRCVFYGGGWYAIFLR